MSPRPALTRTLLAALVAATLATSPQPRAAGAATAATELKPPATRMQVVRDTLFGTVIADRFRWLEDQQSPDTRAWLEQQEQYYRDVMKDVPGRDRLRARLDSLLRVDDCGIPTERANRQFFLKRSAQQDLRVLTMRDMANGREQVLLDPARMSIDRSVSIRLLDVSNDGSTVAVGIQKGGEDEVEVAFFDVATRNRRAQMLPKARYTGVRFGADAKQVYYSRFGKDGPRVYRHMVGTSPDKDALLFGSDLGREKIASVSVSDDGVWLLISVSHGSAGDQVELYAKNLKANSAIAPIVNDVKARFDAKFGGGNTLFVRTNWKAPRGRIVAIDLTRPTDAWREVLPEGPNVLDSWTPAGGNLIVSYSLNVLSQVYLLASDGRVLGAVPMGGEGTVRGLSGRSSQSNAYLTFESTIVPPRIQRVVATTNAVTTWWQSASPFRSADYEMTQVWFASKDGARIPMFVSRRRDVPKNGTAPAYLTGYGGFAVNEAPVFSARAALWMENGGVWAVPALRGGSEFGEAWHEAGMLAKKQNTFDDFIGAAEALVAQRFISKERLAIAGGSNGGLLVGAALTQRPDLFRAVVCSVPLLDMLRYQRFLVARFWVPEYGSSEKEDQFRTLYAYSPYHRVKIGTPYPAVLFMSGDSDTRVDPLHARKMTALLQSSTGSDQPVLLHYDTGSGHSGGKPVSKTIDDESDVLQFLFWQLGITPREGPPPPLPPTRPTRDTQP